MNRKTAIAALLVTTIVFSGGLALVWKTMHDLQPLPNGLHFEKSPVRKMRILDRDDAPLTTTYRNRWNVHDYVPLHEIPALLQKAFIASEDRRFYTHNGVDWKARIHALFQNIGALEAVRGASTITEQVIRMWRPRPRTLWSRWLEGWEAVQLEKTFSKGQILECYLNQVPYAALRRGVVQAARHYFDRDLNTLSVKEILALTVMVRAPGRLNVYTNSNLLERPIHHLARRLYAEGTIESTQIAQLNKTLLQPGPASPVVHAEHFVQYFMDNTFLPSQSTSLRRLRTTLSGPLQSRVQQILDHRLRDLKKRGVQNGAVLVVDHQTSEILAWVNGGDVLDDVSKSWIDGVTTPRQPGSTLKPFLYALALEKGWTAATLLDDLPLTAPVGRGLHTYHNYSRTYYGRLPLRYALGNSLNTPAVRTIQFVGISDFLARLGNLGIHSLEQRPDYYGEGLALGNGEITLLELVGAYGVLARQGIYRPLQALRDDALPRTRGIRVFSPEASSLIAHILSDPNARRLEFGPGSLLRFPVQTAVKTGTSSDYRDAWAVGFDDRYTVGAWVGNLDHRSTNGITGAAGPALILRSVFAELNRNRQTNPLYLSPRLVKVDVCRETGAPSDDGACTHVSEWFVPGTEPPHRPAFKPVQTRPSLQTPTPGLQMAMDPRIPDTQEAFPFQLSNLPAPALVEWIVDGKPAARTPTSHYLWPLSKGRHQVIARVWMPGDQIPQETGPVNFVVK